MIGFATRDQCYRDNQLDIVIYGITIYIDAKINRVACKCKVDTGAEFSIIPKNLIKNKPIYKSKIETINAQSEHGIYRYDIEIDGKKSSGFAIKSDLDYVILGMDILSKCKFSFFCNNFSIELIHGLLES